MNKNEEAVAASPIVQEHRRWFQPRNSEIVEALRTGLVAIDTNVLLNLYKYDEKGTRDWFKALSWIGTRLYLPNQSMLEFWRNRSSLAVHPEHTRKARTSVVSGLRNIKDAYTEWARVRTASMTEDQESRIESVVLAVEQIISDLDTSEEFHRDRFDSDPVKDEVVKGLALLAPHTGPSARLGEPYPSDELNELFKEGDKRFAEKVPPGYLDDANNGEAKAGKAGDTKYGDWILWSEVLAQAKKFQEELGRSKPYVVLVTGDAKSDWWRRHPINDGEESVKIARPELVEEMQTIAQCKYVQLSPSQLLQFLQRTENSLVFEETTVQSAEALAAEAPDDEWIKGEFVVVAHRVVRARARIAHSGQCRVFAGSSALPASPSMPKTYHRLTDTLLRAGQLKGTAEEGYIFAQDCDFPSPSAAASIVQGSSTSGNTRWMHESGVNLGELRENVSDDIERGAVSDDDE